MTERDTSNDTPIAITKNNFFKEISSVEWIIGYGNELCANLRRVYHEMSLLSIPQGKKPIPASRQMTVRREWGSFLTFSLLKI